MKIILFQEQKTDAKNIRELQPPQEKGGLKEKERSVGRPSNTRRAQRRSQSPRKTLSPEKAVSPTETSDSQSPVLKRRPRRARTQEKENTQEPVLDTPHTSSPQKLRPPRQKGGGGGGGEVRAKPSSDFTVDIFTAKTTEERDKERSEAEQEQDQQVGTVLTNDS